jgi:hypothetical protein
VLIARKDRRRHPRVAARWLLRYLEERPEAAIEEAAMATAALAPLGSERHKEAAYTLRAMAERQNRCGRVTHGSVGSTPAPLRRRKRPRAYLLVEASAGGGRGVAP